MEIKLKNIEKINIDFSYTCDSKKIILPYNNTENGLQTEYNGIMDEVCFSKYGSGYIIKRKITNNGSKDVYLNNLTAVISNLTFNGESKRDFFYHPENVRIYGVFTFPVDYVRTEDDALNSEFDVKANNRWADPGVVSEKIGNSPYQPYPAILVGNSDCNEGLIHGTLSQDVFFHNYLIKHDENRKINLTINSSFKDTDCRALKQGETIYDEWFVSSVTESHKIQKLFTQHTQLLREKIVHHYKKSANKNQLVWGSWNDGIFRNVSEQMLLNEADVLKEYFPMVKWIQLDDGYSVINDIADGISVPYKKNSQFDKEKFPNGLKAYSDKIKQKGFRTAIWIGGLCPKHSPLYKEHPDWFLDYRYRINDSAPLDVSIKEVREYMCYALDVLISQSGFEGVKHDFWSYSFDDSHNLYKNKDKSGYEYRKWWMQELRKRLPDDGYMQSCCDLVMGNVFYGEYFNNYRFGIDVGEGNWENIKANYLWGTACLATQSGDIIIPNGDGIGLFPSLNDRDCVFLINYLVTAHCMVELAGKFSQVDKKSHRFKMLQKAVCCINNGENVYFVNDDYIKNITPSVMYFNSPQFSLLKNNDGLPIKTVGTFNIEEDNKDITFSVDDLLIAENKYLLYDIWSGDIINFNKVYKKTFLPHESHLFAVIEKNVKCLYDANIQVDNLTVGDDCIDFTLAYGGNGKFVMSDKVKNVLVNNEKCDCKIVDNIVYISVNAGDKIKVYF